jgi:hypothetical protein
MKFLILLSSILFFCSQLQAQTCERTETFDNNTDVSTFDDRDFDYVKAYSSGTNLTTEVIGGLDGNYFSGRQLVADFNGESYMGFYFYKDVKLKKFSFQLLEGSSNFIVTAYNNGQVIGRYQINSSASDSYVNEYTEDYIFVNYLNPATEFTFSSGVFNNITEIRIEQENNNDLKIVFDKIVFEENCASCSFGSLTESFSDQFISSTSGTNYPKTIGCLKYSNTSWGLYFEGNDLGVLLNMNVPFLYFATNSGKISSTSTANNFKIDNCKIAFRNNTNTFTFEGYDNGTLVATVSGFLPGTGGVYGSGNNQITYDRTDSEYGNLTFSSNWWNIDEIKITSSGPYLEVGLDDIEFASPVTLPTLTSTAASSILSTTVSSGGNISSDGGSSVTARGVCWSTSANPTITDSKTSDGTGTGSFTSAISGLIGNTTYHFRAYATNSVGTSYGEDLSFTTSNITSTLLTETFQPTWIMSTDPITMNYLSVIKQTDPEVFYNGRSTSSGYDLDPTKFDNYLYQLTNVSGYEENSEVLYYTSNVTTQFLSYNLLTLKTINVFAEQNGSLISFSGYVGSTQTIASVQVNLLVAGTYGSGNTTITVTRNSSYNGQDKYSTLTFGSGWSNINKFQLTILTDSPTTIYLDKIVHEIASTVSLTPVSQNFNDGFGGNSNASTFSSNSVTIGNTTYSFDYNSMDFWTTTQANMSGTSLVVNQNSSSHATYFNFSSANNSNNFKLVEFDIARINEWNGSTFDIIGYDNGSSVVTVNNVSLASSATYGSGNDAITYTKNGAVVGGKLAFGSSWQNIDEVRIYLAGGGELHFEFDNLVLSTPLVVPSVSTTEATSVLSTSASSGGSVTTEGSSSVTAKGVCWSTTSNPTISNSISSDGTGSGSFSSSLTGLLPNTTYHYRAYATNSIGTGYGSDLTITTSSLPSESDDWAQITKLVNSDRQDSDNYGYNVSMSGDYAIVGAPFHDNDAANGNSMSNAGAAYILKLTNGKWSQVQKIVSSDRAVGDNFGYRVAIDGNYIVVGAWAEDEDATGSNTKSNAGSAYIFKNNSGTWSEVKKIVNSDRTLSDNFGISVAISGDYVAVGSHLQDFNESGVTSVLSAGAVYIYQNNSDSWTQIQKIVASDRSTQDYFGTIVSIDGDYIVVGARQEGTEDFSATISPSIKTTPLEGAVYIYKNISGTWSQMQKLTAPIRGTTDLFGFALDIDDDFIVVGAYQEDEDALESNTLSNAGSVYIFQNFSDTWMYTQKIVSSNRVSDGTFGRDLSIYGNNLLVGAPGENTDVSNSNSLSNAGAAYMFEKVNGAWVLTKKLVSSDRNVDDNFGYRVATNGIHTLVMAYLDDEDASGANTLNNAGAGYAFSLAPIVNTVTVPSNGTYGQGQNLDFTVNFYNSVNVTGTPTISFTLGSTTVYATYVSGSGTNALLFRYTLQNGDIDADGITVGTLALNGGTISSSSISAILTLNNIGSTSGINVNATGPSTYVSTATGLWSTAGSWTSNAVPSSTDHVQVNNTHTITVSSNTTIDNLILKSGGTIVVTGTAVLTIEGDLQDEGGSFTVASGAQVLLKGNILNNQGTIKVVNTSTNGMVIKGNMEVPQGSDG